ncbi:YihY/virulence factor BrkB family protein [Methylobacterium symbioticum]|nr:YihY/virulence factor BrkB family protein [uncultured Methylobacterium sp.]
MAAGTEPTAQQDRNGVIWTLALSAALVGLVALPRRGGRPARPASGTQEAPRETSGSHEGGAARRAARTEADRGRQAESPSEIPAAGWKDIGLRVIHDVSENRLVTVAAGVTFYVLLAIFPATAALVACYGLFADVNEINRHLASLHGILPSGAVDIVGDQVKRIAETRDGTLGLTAVTGILLSLWSANGGVKSVFDALNVVYEEREKRGFIRLNLISLTFTVGALVFILLAFGAIVVLPVLFQTVGLSTDAWYVALLRWPVLLVAVLLALAALYRYGPSRDAPRWRWVTWGSALAAILWLGGSALFSWYVAHFGTYNKTYGSLGAVIGFMTWIWLSTIIVLIGAEVNAEMEHQTARDTTRGRPEPLGRREARMADTVGEAVGTS